ncbi:MAG TPA: TraB/GumN family protein [Thermoplasmata archaeon]|nr:TraB/GumN family protein [Thermoplasmata archaeon]
MYARTDPAPVLLVGAAHVVDLSGPLHRLLDARVLDGVAIELDRERAEAMFAPEGPGRTARRGPLLPRLWGRIQRRLGAELGGGPPGAEMKVAATIARERGLPLFLVDDPIRDTLANLLRALPVKERVMLLASAFAGLFVPARVVSKEMEQYAAAPEAFTDELRLASPTLARVLVDDRNEHMAARLADLRARGFGRIAAVVGDAHLPGLAEALRRRGVPVETVPFSRLRGLTGPSASPA